MTGKTHQLIGITLGLGYYLTIVKPEYAPATLAAVLVGSHLASLMPDLDQSAAEIWNSIPLGHVAGKVVDPFIKHRNFTHSLLGILIFGYLIYSLLHLFPDYWGIHQNVVFVAMMISFGSHLLADMFTVEGIPLLYPYKGMMGIPPRPFQGIRIMTGKWFENLVLFPIINIVLLVFIISNWNLIKIVLFK